MGTTMDDVGRADVWWSRRTVALLAMLALSELVLRLRLDPESITRTVLTESSVRREIAGTIVRTPSGGVSTQLFLLLCLLCLSTTVPLALSRPTTAAITLTVAGVLSLTVFQALAFAGFAALLIAAYRLGLSGLRVLAGLLGLPFLVLVLTGLAGSTETDLQVIGTLLASLIPAAAVAGIGQRAHRETLDSTAAQRASASTLLEHTARGERARISHELHDVVAHHVSMIAVQAETARLTVPGMPAEGAKQLLGIGTTARAALTEMRRLLGVLREDTQTPVADRQPQPGLRQLNELFDEARNASSAGIRFIVRGPPDPLDPGVELAAYRIVQESLTNARRHAPGAAVDVEMHYTEKALHLRIRDNGPGPVTTSTPGGHGLLGIRERTAAVGGEVRIGPALGGGFLVEASLPTTTEDTE